MVQKQGQIAFERRVKHEAVMAANLKQDYYEDCWLIGYNEGFLKFFITFLIILGI